MLTILQIVKEICAIGWSMHNSNFKTKKAHYIVREKCKGIIVKINLIKIFVYMLFMSVCIMSMAQAAELDKKVSSLIDKSGLKSMIDFIPPQIQSQITQMRITQPNSEEVEFASKTLFKYITVDAMQKKYQSYMVSNLGLELVDSVLKISNKPLFDRITEAEIAASDPNTQGEMVTFITELMSNSPSKERIEIMQRIEDVSQSSALIKYMLEKIMVGMSDTFATSESRDKEVSNDIEQMKSMVDNQMKQQMILQFHYVYRDFSDSELNEYIGLLNSVDFQKFMIVAVNGIGHILLDAFQKGAAELKALRTAKAA